MVLAGMYTRSRTEISLASTNCYTAKKVKEYRTEMAKKQVDKGRALEQAVKFIQETILKSSPDLKGTDFTVETNVRDKSSGVLHEIDVLVKTHLKSDFRATWIFECKNWEKPVDKNQVIILAEKVDALQANRGFIVAKQLTKEASAQLKLKKRLEFIRCSEDFLSPFASIDVFHTVTELLPLVLQVKDRNSPASPMLQNIDWKTIECRSYGRPIDCLSYFKPIIDGLVRDDGNQQRLKYSNPGTHWGEIVKQVFFSKGEFTLGDIDVEYIVIPLKFFVITQRKKLLSKFELEGRGRAYSFEPIDNAESGKQIEIHLVQKL